MPSLTGEAGPAFFDKMGNAFLEIITAEALDHVGIGDVDRFGEGLKESIVDLPLHESKGSR